MISFVVPIVDGKVNVQFPQKCVYCGKPKEFTVSVLASRSTGTQYYRQHSKVTLDVPYCGDHVQKAKHLGLILNGVFFLCLLISCATSILISFALDLQDTFQVCVLAPTVALVFAILTGFYGVRKVWGAFNHEVRDLPGFWGQGHLGIQVFMGDQQVGIAFSNEEYAEEFSRLNETAKPAK
jgi:hypothetical protein